nr:hypothetical protein [Candidatus Sigynarchaeota archaeon]
MVTPKIKQMIPLIAGILAIASLFIPVAFRSYNDGAIYVWYWALNIDTRSPVEIWFNEDLLAVIGGILETVVIIIAAVLLIIASLSIKKGLNNKQLIQRILVASMILLIISPVGYIIGAMAWDIDFWTRFMIHVGLIGPFISAVLALITLILFKRS